MTVRMALLSLAAEEPAHGYELRSRFLERTGDTWPLNIGQVYTTLTRLVRDGLLEELPAAQGEDADKRTYAVTDEGHVELTAWYGSPVARGEAPRDELAMKVVLAMQDETQDVLQVLQVQRREVLLAAQELTRERRSATTTAQQLLVEARLAQVEAEGRWLDLTESRLTPTKGSR